MNRRTLLTQVGIVTTSVTGLNALTSDASPRDSKDTEQAKNTGETKTKSKQPLTVQLIEATPAFEGRTVTITFAVSNPNSSAVTEPVTVERDSWTTVYEETVTVDPSSIKVLETEWDVRHDAAGHSMTLHLSGAEDTDELVVSGRSPFVPTIESIEVFDEDSNLDVVTYSVKNTGSAPDSHTVTVLIDGVPMDKHDMHAGFEYYDVNGKQFTSVFEATGDCTSVTVETESDTVTQQYHRESSSRPSK